MTSSRGRSYCSSPLLISDGGWKESFCYLEKAPELKQIEDPVATPCTTGYDVAREEYVAASKENELVIPNLFVGRTRSIPSSKTEIFKALSTGVLNQTRKLCEQAPQFALKLSKCKARSQVLFTKQIQPNFKWRIYDVE